MPRIEPFDASFTLQDVAPETAERLREQAKARLEASIDGAVSELRLEFLKMIDAVARACSRRVRLDPDSSSPWKRLRGAEVHQVVHGDDGNDIPTGKVFLTVQPCVESVKENDKFVQHGKSEDIVVTSEEYVALRPYETKEFNVLSSSAFENLIAFADKISTIKSMLGSGDGAEGIIDLASQVSTTLKRMGSSADDIAKQIRRSDFVRSSTHEKFSEFFATLSSQCVESKTLSSPRRIIRKGSN